MAHSCDSIKNSGADLPTTPGRPGVAVGTATAEQLARKHLFSLLGTPPGMDPKDALGSGMAVVPQYDVVTETPMHRIMVLLRGKGMTFKDIAAKVEYSEGHVRNVCAQPWAQQRLNQMAMDAETTMEDLLAGEMVKCVETLKEIRDDVKAPASCRLQAVGQMFDRFLGKAVATTHNINENKNTQLPVDMSELDRELQAARDRQAVLAGKPPVRTVTVTVTESRSVQE